MGRDTLWLVGMMGAGKSTVGPVLASRLHCRFLDVDAEIERAEGRSISDIFTHSGENTFRRIERAAIDAIAGERAVVALGGGAIAQPGAPERLARTGTVVYLRGRPDTLLERVGDCAIRPILRDLTPSERVARLRALLRSRSSAYETASIVVDVDAAEVDDIVDRACEDLERMGRWPHRVGEGA